MSILKKKVEVIMLPTPQKTRIQKFGASLRDNKNPLLPHVKEVLGYYQELYFVDDSPIIENDWIYNTETQEVIQCIGKGSLRNWKKIVASSDRLEIGKYDDRYSNVYISGKSINPCLPKPSDSFIASYIKAFNEGNPIKYVMVDWEEKGYWMNLESHSMAVKPEWINTHDELKVDKNNTITITRCKENYSAEEVNKILDSFAERFVANTDMAYKQKDIADWKTQNL